MTPLAVVPRPTGDRALYAEELRKLVRKTADNIVQMGVLLIDAKERLPHGSFAAMVTEDLGWNMSAAQRLMAIARHPVLADTATLPLLPPSREVLYKLATIPTEKLEQAIADGKVTPSLTMTGARQLAPRAPHPAAIVEAQLVEPESRQRTQVERCLEWEHGVVVGAQAAISALRQHPEFQVLAENITVHVLAELWATPQRQQIGRHLRAYIAAGAATAPTDDLPAPAAAPASKTFICGKCGAEHGGEHDCVLAGPHRWECPGCEATVPEESLLELRECREHGRFKDGRYCPVCNIKGIPRGDGCPRCGCLEPCVPRRIEAGPDLHHGRRVLDVDEHGPVVVAKAEGKPGNTVQP